MSLKLITTRIRSAVSCVVLLAAVFLLAGAATQAYAAPGDLLAQGNEDGLWLAQVFQDSTNPKQFVTLVRFRDRAGETWTDVSQINSRVTSIAVRGSQLAVLEETGEWLLIWPGGSAIGQAIPGQATIRALASSDSVIWAVAAVPLPPPGPLPEATTRPATAPTTQAETPSKLVLYRLDQAGWSAVHDIDAPADASVAMTANRGVPLVVTRLAEHYRGFTGGQRSSEFQPAKPSAFSLLANDTSAWIWFEDGAAGSIAPFAEVSKKSRLTAPKDLPDNSDLALAVSTGRLRLLFTKTSGDNVTVYEQKYDLKTLAPIDAPTAFNFATAPVDSTIQTLFSAVVTATLVFSVMVSFQNRDKVRSLFERETPPEVAGWTARLSAAAIDLIPIWISFAMMAYYGVLNSDWAIAMQDPRLVTIGAIGLSIYLLHTTLSEVIAGRSFGKMVMGLNVIGLDGQPAPTGAIVLRNILRVVDLFLLGLMIFSPFRQRVGDMVAGTLVVSNVPRASGPDSMPKV